jgi:hypothetical protein
MAFTKISPKVIAPDSPDILFRELPRRKFPDVLPHQKAIMQQYAAEAMDVKDVALQLPTGSGKTLVGLLIADWRRRKNQEKIVYLCPTKQLVHQVVEQAEQKYGLTVVGFTGSQRNYNTADKTKYNQNECVAVTTYSSLFNTNPYFSNADVILVDDAHAAENYVAKLWTLSISRYDENSQTLHSILSSLFKKFLDPACYSRLTGQWTDSTDASWVDKVPSPVVFELYDEICEILDTNTGGANLQYSWSMLRSHLKACHIYLSSSEILIRPMIPPTWAHDAFNTPKQRIYMSATLGEGGDLERLLGRENIYRLSIPEGWDTQGVGRRYFLFPSLSLDLNDTRNLRRALLKDAPRSIILVPNDHLKNEIVEDVDTKLDLKIFLAENIETSKLDFVNSTGSVGIFANRYDGIDFPGDECRLLLIEGLPKAVNLQEKFLMSRMGANILFNERVQTRVLQAIGRCTRSLEDYSAVVIMGDELPDYLADPKRRDYFHPELQAELLFGVEQSKSQDVNGFVENYKLFIKNDTDWEEANQMIVESRKSSVQKSFPSIEQLARAVKFEIKYQVAMWNEDYVEALSNAESVIGILKDSQLRGYRALWEYLAGSASILSFQSLEDSMFDLKAKEHFYRAKKAAKGVPWLVKLASYSERSAGEIDEDKSNSILMLQVENIEKVLSILGTTHDRSYSSKESMILSGLQSGDKFEESQQLLGEHLGFDSGKVESTASPDPWWQLDNICIVFEDHANANKDSSLDPTKARQATSHPAWMRDNVPSCKSPDVQIFPVLVTPVSTVYSGTLPHLSDVGLWKLDDFNKWAINSMAIIRELRKTFIESGDLVWRVNAAETIQKAGVDMLSLNSTLRSQIAKDILVEK